MHHNMTDLREDPHEQPGGPRGLMHIMRDKEVQMGLRPLARTAGRIKEQAHSYQEEGSAMVG